MVPKCTYSHVKFFLIRLGYDVIAQAQSGTGKTATFAISILQQIELDLKATQALVLAPTRELAQQVSASLPCPGGGFGNGQGQKTREVCSLRTTDWEESL